MNSKDIQLEGKNPVLEALKSGRKASKIYLFSTQKRDEKVDQIISLAKERKIPCLFKERSFLNRIAKTLNHQGVIGLFEPILPQSLKSFLSQIGGETDTFLVLFTQIDFEQNLGAILRTAEAAGVSGVVIPPRSVGLTPVVERTSMGASNYVPVIVENLFAALKILRKEGFKIIGLDPSGERAYYQTDLSGQVALVVGGEDRGVSDQVKERCDLLIRIPQKGKISSLNMSVATALVIYERLRQEELEKMTEVKNRGK